MKYLFILVAASLICLSCKKNSVEEKPFWECSSVLNNDSASMVNKLIGSWKLASIGGGMVPGFVGQDVPQVELIFNQDLTYVVKGNVETSGNGSWSLVFENGQLVELAASAHNMYLYGSMRFCENKIGFFNSALDGPDYVFTRK